MAPARIEFSDSGTFDYINRDTKDRFWDKILERTSKGIKTELYSFKPLLLSQKTVLAISLQNRQMFNISDRFLVENGLDGIILWNYG